MWRWVCKTHRTSFGVSPKVASWFSSTCSSEIHPSMPSRCMISALFAPVSTMIGSSPPRMRKPKVGAFTRTPMFRASTRKLESSSMSMRFRSLISGAIAFPFPGIVAGFVGRHTPFPGGCQADLVRLRRGGSPAPRRRIGMPPSPIGPLIRSDGGHRLQAVVPLVSEEVGTVATARSVARDLASVLGAGAVLAEPPAAYLADQTEGRGLTGRADAVALPGSTDEVAAAVAWCYDHDVPIVPRGGGTGFAGGAVPIDGGVVLSLERLIHVRSFEPLLWRIEVEAGLRTAELRRIVRESGLLFPPDPGAAEQSQIGGNIATNAGGPHAFKYGVTGAWVTGLEAVVPPGEVVTAGGPVRKDVAGYDLVGLLTGSEGTLGIVTAAWLRLIPAVESALPLAAVFPSIEAGCAGIEALMGSGVVPACIEYA